MARSDRCALIRHTATFLQVSPLGRLRQHGEATVVELDGEADLAALPQLSQLLSRAIATATGTIIVDLDGLIVLDDAALGLVIGAAATARRNGCELRIVCSDPKRRDRLADTRIDRIVAVQAATQAPTADTPTTATSPNPAD